MHGHVCHLVNCFVKCMVQPYRCDGEMVERIKIDRRRLEHAHFRYAILKVTKWYRDLAITKVLFTSDQAEGTLLEFTPLYLKAFYENYSGMLQ